MKQKNEDSNKVKLQKSDQSVMIIYRIGINYAIFNKHKSHLSKTDILDTNTKPY